MEIKFIECKVLMTDDKHESITGKPELSWADCVIKTDEIIAIRRSTDEDHPNYAVIHFRHNEYFIVDLMYDKVAKWYKGK